VRDAAISYQAMAIWPSGFVPPNKIGMRGVRIGVPRNYYFDRVDPEVAVAVKNAIAQAERMGALIVDLEVPDMVALTQAGATCLLAEAASALRPYLDRRDDFGEDVLTRLDQGRAILAIDYLDALRVRRRTHRAFAGLWQHVDCLFTPSTPMTAPLIDAKFVRFNGEQEEVRAAATRFTRSMNALGLPAISLPCGFSRTGMPIGLQIIGGRDRDDFVLQVAAAMEDDLKLAGRLPPLAS
jgi:aspartyl-tRNA(Asn)/glutamyl-tRNA(Gln) amidotransferase subunit A